MTEREQSDALEAERAKAILEAPVFERAWKLMYDDALNALLNGDPADDDKRYRDWVRLRTILTVKDTLLGIIKQGEAASRLIAEQNDLIERLRRARHDVV